MSFPEFDSSSSKEQWQRFCNLLWHDDKLGISLDISKMHINSSDFINLEDDIQKGLCALESLESGSISNIDENRQVGHYWLREPKLAPTENISTLISEEIQGLSKFVDNVLSGKHKSINSEILYSIIIHIVLFIPHSSRQASFP